MLIGSLICFLGPKTREFFKFTALYLLSGLSKILTCYCSGVILLVKRCLGILELHHCDLNTNAENTS